MDLFEAHRRERLQQEAPLAERMRPRDLNAFVGQEEILGPGAMLREAIERDRLQSLILYGPPGTGKTTLARIIALRTDAAFVRLNAAEAGVRDVRKAIDEAGRQLGMHERRTILFLDEIHRFNKAQQDALLPAVEDGTVILIGATTENPLLTLNAPLLSRSRLFRFEPLGRDELTTILDRALRDEERGLGSLEVSLSDEARDHLVQTADGDARELLNALELAAMTTKPAEDGTRLIELAAAEEAVQRRAIRYDRAGDAHYDTISAFIKSMRGSDPDATLYWLARMLYAGEDPRFVARRIVIHAAEDVGLADPRALTVAAAAAQSVELVGMPECRIPLAQAALYVALAPKSNAVVRGIGAAWQAVEDTPISGVPVHLRDTHYRGARERLGHGEGYRYPHDDPDAFNDQQYLPEELAEAVFFQPTPRGWEAERASWLEAMRRAAEEQNPRGPGGEDAEAPG